MSGGGRKRADPIGIERLRTDLLTSQRMNMTANEEDFDARAMRAQRDGLEFLRLKRDNTEGYDYDTEEYRAMLAMIRAVAVDRQEQRDRLGLPVRQRNTANASKAAEAARQRHVKIEAALREAAEKLEVPLARGNLHAIVTSVLQPVRGEKADPPRGWSESTLMRIAAKMIA